LGYCFDSYEGHILRETGRTKRFEGRYLVKISECLQQDLIDTVSKDHIAFSEQKASTTFRHLIRGLKELHDSGEVHRDLKLDNIMFTHALSKEQAMDHARIGDDDLFLVKIIDCGAAETLPVNSNYIRGKSQHGTSGYFAPETLGPYGFGDTDRPPVNRFVHWNASDVWQAGIALYVLLFQCFPYYDIDGCVRKFSDEADLPKNAFDIRPRFVDYSPEFLVFPSATQLSEVGKNLFKRIFVLDPKNRITCDEILTHDWIIEFTSLSDEDFGPEYRKRVKQMALRRELRSSIERSVYTCTERKSRLLESVAPIKISTVKFRELQREFLRNVQVAGTGIDQETFIRILNKEGLAALATEEAFKAIDIDGNNTIEYLEFLPILATFREKTSIQDEELQTCMDYFQIMDLDGDGKVTRCHLLTIFILFFACVSIEI